MNLFLIKAGFRGVMWRDTQVEQDIARVLKWLPGLDARAIGVYVHNGIVTLTGEVVDDVTRTEVEALVRQVTGVVVVTNKLAVRYLNAIRGAPPVQGRVLASSPSQQTYL